MVLLAPRHGRGPHGRLLAGHGGRSIANTSTA
jgi:hypothetical protein